MYTAFKDFDPSFKWSYFQIGFSMCSIFLNDKYLKELVEYYLYTLHSMDVKSVLISLIF